MRADLSQSAPRGRRAVVAAACMLAASPAAADAVTDWNDTFDTVSFAVGGPPQRSYLGAMMHIAIHDALNSIQPRYARYAVVPTASAAASPDAAIATAARDVLLDQLARGVDSQEKSDGRALVRARYAQALAAIPDGDAETQGVAAGRAAAAAIISMRANDGSDRPNLPYTLAPGLGVHQPTPPNFPPPSNAGWALLEPFVMRYAAQFRAEPSPIFVIDSAAYTRDYLEVKAVGSRTVRAANPDSDGSRMARYWQNGGNNWSAITRGIVATRNLDRWQHARLFALLKLAEADAAIAVFDTKYHYNFWRPVTAIRWADDGNPDTPSDPDWLPYITTPPYPDFTCNLTVPSGAATEVLRRYFGTDAVPYTLTVTIPRADPANPDVITRSYATLSQAATESVHARVFSGLHFRDGCAKGVEQGQAIARLAVQHFLQPQASMAVRRLRGSSRTGGGGADQPWPAPRHGGAQGQAPLPQASSATPSKASMSTGLPSRPQP